MNMTISTTSKTIGNNGIFGRLSKMVFSSKAQEKTNIIYSAGGIDFIHATGNEFKVRIDDTEKKMTLDTIRAVFGVFTAYQLESRLHDAG